MYKVAHIATAYMSVVTILDSKLRGLSSFNDLDVTVISSPSAFQDSRKPAVRYISLPIARSIKPFADLKSIWLLYKVFRKEEFDIVHSHTAKAGFITAVAAKIARIPIVCHTYHGLPFFEGQNKKAYILYRYLEKFACLFRDYVFTQNKRDMPECAKLIGSKDRVLLEGNGVDVELVRQIAENQLDQAIKEFPDSGTRLVLLSRLEHVKHVDDFLKIVKILIQRNANVSCVVAGCGALEQQLKNKLVELQLGNCVNIIGFTDRPLGLIAASDIVVLCSEKEGIPRVIMEAMALSKPVVATDVLGTQELVVDGQTGFLVPLGDIEKMAKKIEIFVNDQGLRMKMGSEGLKRVVEKFSDFKIAEFLREFYLSKFLMQ